MRKIFISIVILSVASGMKVQASTIALKDGRKITGDIIEQSAAKVIAKVNDIPLTYYKDEIASIDGKPFSGPPVEADPVKEGLAEQFLKIYPTENLVDEMISNFVPDHLRPTFLIFLKEHSYIRKFTEMRKDGVIKSFSTASLKAMINFFTSSDGKEFYTEMGSYNAGPMLELRGQIHRDMQEAMRQFKQDKGNRMEQPPSAEPAIGPGSSIKADPEKEKLVDQFLEIFPTEDLANGANVGVKSEKSKQSFLKFLKENSYIQKFTEMRKDGLMENLSSASLKAAIDFYTSPEGEQFRTEMKNYSAGPMREFQKLMFREMKEARSQFKQSIRNDQSEQAFSGNSP